MPVSRCLPIRRPVLDSRRIWDYILHPGAACVSSICILPCTVSSGGPDILLITYSRRSALVYLSTVLVNSLCSPYRHLTHGHLGCKVLGNINPTLREDKLPYEEEKREREKRRGDGEAEKKIRGGA